MDGLTIEYFGQACILVRSGSVAVLCDPWFSGASHLGGWIPFPAWSAEERAAWRARADEATHVYVSHAHEDHFDPAFLRSLAPKQILVGEFRNQRFRAALEALRPHHTIRYLRDGETVALGSDVTATIHLERPAFRTNSMLLLGCPDGDVLNANDCGLDSATLRAIARRRRPAVFLYTLNFLANGFPFPYLRRRDPDLSARIAAVRDQVVASFRIALGILRPALGVGFAGPVSFADRVNHHLDDHPEARDWRHAAAELSSDVPVIWPAPGGSTLLRAGRVARVDPGDWDALASSHPVRYEGRGPDPYLDGPQPDQAEVLAAARRFAAQRAALAARLPGTVSTRLHVSAAASLDALEGDQSDWHIAIDLAPPGAARLAETLDPPYLQIASTPAILRAFLDGEADLDAMLVSGRARFRRDPDTFDPLLHNVLRFGDDPGCAAALVEWMTDAHVRTCTETITVTVAGRERRIPRLCPHEGESFEGVPVEHGRLVCPRHKWVFDLESGQCLVGDRTVNLYAMLPEEKL
jgi:UDP-MurNAc hydroxylase